MDSRSFLKILFSVVVFSGCLFYSESADALCVKSSEANLRYGPSTKHKKTWKVYKYMPFRELKSQGGWYRVQDVDSDIHWIYGKLVTDDFMCAVVKVKKANLRSGPGTNHSPVKWGPAEKYYAFKVIKIQGKWANVEDAAGGKAWVYRDLIWVN